MLYLENTKDLLGIGNLRLQGSLGSVYIFISVSSNYYCSGFLRMCYLYGSWSFFFNILIRKSESTVQHVFGKEA